MRTIPFSLCFDSSTAADQDEPTHVSEILAGNGLPVADPLKDGKYEEMVRLVRPEHKVRPASTILNNRRLSLSVPVAARRDLLGDLATNMEL